MAATAAGAQAYRVGIVPDGPEAFLAALIEQSPRADLILTSGGVSQGDWDVVKAALAPRGVWFGGIAMQPGKPQGFGLVDGVRAARDSQADGTQSVRPAARQGAIDQRHLLACGAAPTGAR